MKNRITTIMAILTFILTPALTQAESPAVRSTSTKTIDPWELTDTNQTKIMSQMAVWGFLIALTSALLSIYIPNSTSPNTTTGKAAPQNPSVF